MPLEARYTFSLEDYKSLVRAAQSQSRFGRWGMHIFIAAIMIGVSLFGMIAGIVSGGRLPSVALVFRSFSITLATTALMLGIFEIMLRLPWLQRMSFRRLSVADKPITYSFSDKGVTWTRDGSSGAFDWSTVTAVTKSATALVLMVARAEGAVLPRRGFASQSDFDTALAFVSAHVAPQTPIHEV